MEEKKNSNWMIYTILIIIIMGGILFFVGKSAGGDYDEFAQCLTDNGAKMYGAYWCPHCAEQKKIFGNSWKHVDYVECSLPNRAGTTQICIEENIQSYPTWEFSDGTKVSGFQSLQTLAQKTGCSLN